MHSRTYCDITEEYTKMQSGFSVSITRCTHVCHCSVAIVPNAQRIPCSESRTGAYERPFWIQPSEIGVGT